MSLAACAEDRPEPRRLVVQSAGGVTRAGGMGELFGGANRVVLRVERDGILVEELLLLRVRRSVVAVVNRCPHLGRPLEDARVRGGALRCRGHGRSYSLRTGRVVGTLSAVGPARLTRVPAWTDGGQLLLDLTALT